MYKYLFGPVPSRRLGISLGVDLVIHKICSLDCIYCECGKTTELTLDRKEYVPFTEVTGELEHYFENHPDPDYITFSGSGEPTLSVHIGDVIEFIKSRKPSISVAVLTNGTLLSRPEVRRALLKADLVMPSLDTAWPASFKKLNRPHKSIELSEYIQGLVDFGREYRECRQYQGSRENLEPRERLGSRESPGSRDPLEFQKHMDEGEYEAENGSCGEKAVSGKIALEILILPGVNDTPEDLAALKDACQKIKPDVIQLNTLDRPGAVSQIHAATADELGQVKSFLGFDNIEIIASAPERKALESYREDMESTILETIHRRPCTVKDLVSVLGSHANEINKYISTLEQEGRITSARQERGIFYHSVKS